MIYRVRDAVLKLLLLSLLAGCGHPTLRALGSVKVKQLCSDVKRCDVRGDAAISMLRGRKTTPQYLAAGQGPEAYLGRVAPKRNAKSVLKTCGSDVTRDDWLESGPSVRVIELSNAGKQQFRAALKTRLAQELVEHPAVLAGREVGIDSAVEGATSGLGLQRVSLISQTYWLKDSAFEKRVALCGEEEYGNIIYSMTVVRLSDLTQKELESRLTAGLEAKLLPPPPAPAPAKLETPTDLDILQADELHGEALHLSPEHPPQAPDAREGDRTMLRDLAQRTVRAFASELQLVAALGFDET